MRVDYEKYCFTKKQWLGYILIGTAAYALLGLLLYDCFWPFVVFPAVLVVYLRMIRNGCCQKRKRKLQDMFVPAMEAFVVALQAGYSAETALQESRRDMQRLAGEEDPMVRELIYMEKQMGVSVPLEELFRDLSERSSIEDIRDFARVFGAGKRTGGDLYRILTTTVQHMKQRQETRKDIVAEVASRRMEQNIMSLVPCGILLYLRLTSPEYIEVFYTTTAGRVTMTGCLGLYLAAWFWGQKITALEV